MISYKFSFRRVSPLKNKHSFSIVFFSFFLLLLTFWGCQEEPGFIGLEIQPPGDKLAVKFSRTNDIKAFTFTLDSMQSDNYGIQLLGDMKDPVFGLSKADFISKMTMSIYNQNFGVNPVVDSMFLNLRLIGGKYGDNSSSHLIKVYELTDTIYYDSAYYSNIDPLTFHVPATPIASHIYLPSANDTVIKIPITNSAFRDKMIQIDSASKATEKNFQKYFAGLYVTAERQNDPGSIFQVSLSSGQSNLTMHYSDTLVYRYQFGNFVPKVNLFRQDYSSTVFYPKLNQSVIQDSVYYVQSMAGLAGKLSFSGLETWKDSVPVAINKARLILPAELQDATSSAFPRPDRLILLARDSEGKLQTISDYNAGITYFGGTYSAELNAYVFTITNQVQKFIQGTVDKLDLYLLVNDQVTTANRVVLTSGSHSRPISLEITYQRF